MPLETQSLLITGLLCEAEKHSVCPTRQIRPDSGDCFNACDSVCMLSQHQMFDLDVVANTFHARPRKEGAPANCSAIECAVDSLRHQLAYGTRSELRHRNANQLRSCNRSTRIRKAPMMAVPTKHRSFRSLPDGRAGHARTADHSARENCCCHGLRHWYFSFVRLPGDVSPQSPSRSRFCTCRKPPAHEMGMGTATVQRHHAADRLQFFP